MFEPAVFGEISEGVIVAGENVAVEADVHKEGLVHLLGMISFLGEGAPESTEVMESLSKAQDGGGGQNVKVNQSAD